MNSRITRVLMVVMSLIVFFAAGYFVSEYRNGRVIESIYYTDLLTDVRWRLRTLEAIENRKYEEAVSSLLRQLKSDATLLEQFQADGKLGTEGQQLLEAAKKRTHKLKE